MRSLVLAGLVGLTSAAGVSGQDAAVYRVPITGVIENGLAPYVARALREAAARNAVAVILDIDTPGGRIDAAERIVDAVRASPVPVYAFVNPRAYSAGALIALAAKGGIYMVPGGVIGAATPVDGRGTKASEKIVSAMRGEFRSLAEANGVDPTLAESMVDESIEIPGLKPAGKLLTLTTTEAVELGFARGAVDGWSGMLGAVGLSGAPIAAIDPNWAEQIVRFLTNPIVAPLLLSLGMLGLIFEIKAGSFGLGALVSLASLGLFFGSNMLLGLAGWEEIILLGLGLLALGVEVFVLPGFGVAGVIGLCLVGGATVLALLGSGPSATDFVQAGAILAASLVITASVFLAWIRHLPSSTRFAGLFLKDATRKDEGFVSAPVRDDLIGRAGQALTDLRPAGVVSVDGERVDVVTEGEFVLAGSAVTVLRAEGYRHVVRAVDALATAPDGPAA